MRLVTRTAMTALLSLLLLLFAAPILADEAKTDPEPAPPATAPADITLEELIEKNIEAKGGREAMDAVKTMRMTGTMTMQQMGEAPFVIELKRPDKARMEIEMQGMTIVQALDGDSGWYIMPMMGTTDPQEMADDQRKQMADMADMDGPLIGYEEKGHTVELVGKEEVEGTEMYKVKLTKDTGDEIMLYLDAEYYLELRTTGKLNVQGTEVEGTTILGDYKEVGDLVMAHSMEQSFGGPAMMTMTIKEVELNPEISDDRFMMPKAEAPAEGEASGE